MRLFIYPSIDIEGVYTLLTEQGETLASHFCSSKHFAKDDLEGHRPERQTKWKQRFGNYTVQFLDEQSEITPEELFRRNEQWWKSLPESERN